MDDVIDAYLHPNLDSLQVDVEDLFKEDNIEDVMKKIHRFASIILYYNGDRVTINTAQVTFVNNKESAIEFYLVNLTKIIVKSNGQILYVTPNGGTQVLFKPSLPSPSTK